MSKFKNLIVAAVMVLFVAFGWESSKQACAQDASRSPVGEWEATVTGTVDGESVKGTAFVAFTSGGVIEGYFVSRAEVAVWELSGVWQATGTSFTGTVTATLGFSEYSFSVTGNAKAGKKISATLSDGSDVVKLKGKPRIALSGRVGVYSGTYKQTGYPTSDLELELIEHDDYEGVYIIEGMADVEGEPCVLSGTAIVDRKGQFIGTCDNLTLGTTTSFIGKFKSGGKLAGKGVVAGVPGSLKFTLVSG